MSIPFNNFKAPAKSGLYHTDIWMPKGIKACLHGAHFEFVYSAHALEQARLDRLGVIPFSKLPTKWTFDERQVIEVETGPSSIHKIVIRVALTPVLDIVVAFTPWKLPAQSAVRTVWLNLKSDQHETLKRELYIPHP